MCFRRMKAKHSRGFAFWRRARRRATEFEMDADTPPLEVPITPPQLNLAVAARNVVLMAVLTLTTAWMIHTLFGSVMLMTALSLAVAYAVVVGGSRIGLLCALAVFGLLLLLQLGPEWLATLGGARGQAVILEVLACLVVLLLAVAVELRRQVAARYRDAEAGRQRQAAFVHALLDGLGPEMFVAVLGPDGTILEVNRSLSEVFGLSRETLIGRRVDEPDWLDGEDMQRRMQQARQAAAQGRTSRFDLRVRTSGGLRWVDYSIGPLRDRDGRLRCLVASALDITERRQAERVQKAIFDTVPTALLLVDRSGCITEANRQAAELLGYPLGGLIGQRLEKLLPASARGKHQSLLEGYFDKPSSRIMGGGRDLVAVRADGSTVPVEIGLNPLPVEHGEYVIAAVADITDRRAAQQTLEEAASRLEAEVDDRTRQLQASNARWVRRGAQLRALGRMLDRMPGCDDEQGLAEVVAAHAPEVFPDSSGIVCLESEGDYRLCARWGDEVGALQPSETLDPGSRHSGPKRWRGADTGAPVMVFHMPMRSGEDHLGSLECLLPTPTVRDEEEEAAETEFLLGRIAHNFGMAITNLRLRQSLEAQATRDALTLLYNRRHLDTEGARMVASARRHDRPLAVLAADIDHFKHINDTHGHEVGDRVLCSMADIMRAQLRAADLPCRYGGEEFVVLLPDTGREEALQCAERIRAAIASAELEPLRGPLTVSLGVAAQPEDGDALRELIAAADEAMYYAKRNGRNRVAAATDIAPSSG